LAHICDYFPCHRPWKEGMTCKNCYCPLYKYKDCKHFGGNPKFLKDKGGLIKDCSDCTLPHEPDFIYEENIQDF